MVAVLVHQAFAVALQETLSLQPFVEIGGIGRIARRHCGIDDLDIAAEFDAECLRGLAHRPPRPTKSAEPNPWCTKVAAARITCSSSPSAKTTRRAPAQPFYKRGSARRRPVRAGYAIAADRLPYRR